MGKVFAGQPTLACPWVGVHRRTSLCVRPTCPTCLVRLTWIVYNMGGKWPYSYCFVGCCFRDLFNIARCILVQFSVSFFSMHFISVHVVHPYSSIDTSAAWKKFRFILLVITIESLFNLNWHLIW